MEPSSRTPEGQANHCPVCGKDLRIEPSSLTGDAPCPHCGHLLWFPDIEDSRPLHQVCFELATKEMSRENYDFATQLLEFCVNLDSSELVYIQAFLESLKRKYGNDKRRSVFARFKRFRACRAVKKAVRQEKWKDVIFNGLRVLSVNPWDIPALTAMAMASERMGNDKSEMGCLKAALECNPQDPDVNRQCAAALARRQNE